MANHTDDTLLRHAGPDRAFHWLTAATMLVLLGTSLLPVVGIRFAWLVPHWVAGLGEVRNRSRTCLSCK